MDIRIYSEERKEPNIYEYEYIRLKIFEYIRMSEYSLHTGLNQVFLVAEATPQPPLCVSLCFCVSGIIPKVSSQARLAPGIGTVE